MHVLIYLTCLVAGILVGVYVERLRWNKLIVRGIIPRPPKRSGFRRFF